MRSWKLRDAFKKVLYENNMQRHTKIVPQIGNKITGVHVSVLDAGSAINTPSLAIRILGENKTQGLYVFNATHNKGGRVSHINSTRAFFLTSLSWQAPGQGNSFLLHVPNNFQIHGPPGTRAKLDYLFSSLHSRTAYRKSKAKSEFIENNLQQYADEYMTVKKLLLSSDRKCLDSMTSHDTVAYLCHVKNIFRRERDSQMISGLWPDETNRWKTTVESFETDFCLDPPKDKQLVSCNVTETGKNFKFLVLECPTIDHLSGIERSSEIDEIYHDTPTVIAHITPECVLKDSLYQDWMRRFDNKCTHIILNNKNDVKYDHSTYFYQSTLNAISPQLFPAPKRELLMPKIPEGKVVQGFDNLEYKVYHDADYFGLNKQDLLYLKAKEKFQESISLAEEEIKNLQQELNFNDDPSSRHYFPRLSVLGCGSSQCNKYRNPPGFLLRLSTTSSIVIDCGYGSLLRIYQQFGDKAEDILSSIKVIFISHIHLDHHLGFLTLFRAIVEAKKKMKVENQLYCLMTDSTHKYYCNVVNQYTPDLKNYATFESVSFPSAMSKQNIISLHKISQHLGVQFLRLVNVNHGVITHGLVLLTECGKKIVYSSDTKPMNWELINQGKKADLLIHDCLFAEDDWAFEATMRNHSYLKGALATSKAMRAKFTMLTHFAAFLPVVPVSDIPPEHATTTAFANDFLNVSISDVHKLPKLVPVLETVFEESLHKFSLQLPKLKRRHDRMIMRISSTARNL